MKRIINGKAYNTETAEVIAETSGTFDKDLDRNYSETWEYHTTLYRTPKGAWFTMEEEWPENDKEKVRLNFDAITLDLAIDWVGKHTCTLHNEEYFPSIEEA